jgi:proline racemase
MPLKDSVHTIDTHTAGGPTRIAASGLPLLKGKTVGEKMEYFKEHYDHYRKLLIWEPRGHSGMFGAVLTEPCREEADLGVFFLTASGYLNMCVHSALGVAAAALSTGRVDRKKETVILDTPSGIIGIRANHEHDPPSLTLRSAPAFVYAKEVEISIPRVGRIPVDVAFSSVYFVMLDVNRSELTLHADRLDELAAAGRELIREINNSLVIKDPFSGNDEKAVLAILYKDHSREAGSNAVFSSTGSLDRSPCGAGTGARLALLHSGNRLDPGEVFTNSSLINTRFSAYFSDIHRKKDLVLVTPNITGESYVTGFHHFVSDPGDTLDPFLLP